MSRASSVKVGALEVFLILAFTVSLAPAARDAFVVPPESGRPVNSSQQSQKAPEWVTKGAAAFPELQKKGLIGWASALVKDYDSSDEARDNARNWALGDIAGTLGDLVDSVVNTYAEYAEIAAGAPLTRDEIDGWIRKCDGSARDLLKLDQPSKLETYLDKKSGVWHALAWVELPSKTLSFLVVVEFWKEMDALLEKKGVKMKETDAAWAVKTVLGKTLIWADAIGYDWQLVNEVKDPSDSFGGRSGRGSPCAGAYRSQATREVRR